VGAEAPEAPGSLLWERAGGERDADLLAAQHSRRRAVWLASSGPGTRYRLGSPGPPLQTAGRPRPAVMSPTAESKPSVRGVAGSDNAILCFEGGSRPLHT
jgi:hypothetical protein